MAFDYGRDVYGPSFVWKASLLIVVCGVLANLLFNMAAAALGLGYPYSTFLFLPDDRFGDFFKLAFSYPGGPIHPAANFWGLNPLLQHHLADVARFEGTRVNHFHVPPLPTLLALTWRWIMQRIDPVLLFVVALAAVLAALFASVLRLSPKGSAAPALATAALLSYPTLAAIDRGHFFSLVCAILTIIATVRTLRDGKSDIASILMFAVAVNFRPNVGIVPLALFLSGRGLNFRGAVLLGIASVLMFVGPLAFVHFLYPAYSLESFRSGLIDYGKVYAGGALGYPVGSSIYGALRAMFGYHQWHFAPPIFIALFLFAVTVLESRAGRLRASECLFLVLCAYTLGTQIFADYHLLVFIIPLVLLAFEGGVVDAGGGATFAGSVLMLVPKNYLFETEETTFWSWQVVVNPVILFVASVIVIAVAFRRPALGRTRPGMLSVPQT